LTGRPVFEASTPMGVVLAHTKEKPVPPSTVAEREVPASMEELILACLEKDPDARPSTAEDVARRLERTGLAVQWSAERAQRWWETHRPVAEG
jgi:serine/threonine-protein kinase